MAGEANVDRVVMKPEPVSKQGLEESQGQLPQLHFQVEVSNAGDKPVYLQSQLRTLDYDPNAHELTLSFAEPEPAPDGPLYRVWPQTTHVLPGDSESLEVSIPDHITRLSADGIEKVNLSDVQQVRVVLAQGDTPFRGEPGEDQLEQAKRLRAWSEELTHVVPVSEPGGRRGGD